VAIIQGSQNFKNVEPYIKIGEALIQSSEVYISGVDVLHDKRGSLGHGVPYHVQQIDDVDSVLERLEDLNFPPDLCFLDRLQDLYDYPFVVECVDSLVDLRVLAPPDLLYDFVVVLRPAHDNKQLTRI